MELRPYQTLAISLLRESLTKGNRRVLLSSPTGSGKTEIGMEMIRLALAKSKKVAFLANRIHLIDQTSRRFSQSMIPHGIIQGANTSAPWRSVLVASIQTVVRRGLPEDIDLLVIDEAHAVAGTKGYRRILAEFKGKVVIGLTATPYAKGLGKYYGEMGGCLFQDLVESAKIIDLIRDGYLVDAEIWAPSEPDLSGVRIVAGDYDEKQLGHAVDTPVLVGDIVSHWMRLSFNQPTVVFATNITHSKHIRDQFLAAGIAAEHLDCYSTDEDRRQTLARVRGGMTVVVCNVGILAEGWDFPACRTLVLARPTRSLIRYLQMAGRILRPFPGKERALILDHSGTVRNLGFPWDDFPQVLDDGKPKTSAKSEPKERKEPLPTPCPKCTFIKPPRTPICPKCGYEAHAPCGIEPAEGELVPLTKKSSAIVRLEQVGRTSVYHQLLFIADERGYKQGWAANQYKQAFGCWPNGISKVCESPEGVVLDWVRSQQIRYAKRKDKSYAQNIA